MAKSVIVPGVHRYIPPQGLVTVQLSDPDRPWRIKKEVRAENTIMDWYLKQVDNGFRGGYPQTSLDNYTTRDYVAWHQPSFSMNRFCTEAGFTQNDDWRIIIGKPAYWPSVMRGVAFMTQWLWASDQNVTTDSSKAWVPTNDTTGTTTAYASVVEGAAVSADHLARGTCLATDSYATFDQSRMVLEWGSTQGIGTYRTIGIGSVHARETGNEHFVGPTGLLWDNESGITTDDVQQYPYITAANPATDQSSWHLNDSTFNSRIWYDGCGIYPDWGTTTSLHWSGDVTELWIVDEDGDVGLFDPSTWSYTYSMIASGVVSGQCGITHLNSRVWLVNSSNATLYELDEDLSSITVNNSFDLSGSTGGDTFWDITTDGTDLYILGDSDVHKVSNTGVYDSSWSHGQSLTVGGQYNTPSIEYDPTMDHLWLNPSFEHDQTNGTYNAEYSAQWGSRADSSWMDPDHRVYAFSKAGSQLNYTWSMPFIANNDGVYMGTHITGMRSDGLFWCRSAYDRHQLNAPNAVSMVNIGSDVEKTGTDVLKIIYDFDYTV